jgi:hypothetical protein
MFYIILYIILCIVISIQIYKKTSGFIENFISYRVILTDKSLAPVQFILDKETSYIDNNLANCIKSFYPIEIRKENNIIKYVNENNNSMAICHKSQANRFYLDGKINNIELLHDIYYEYVCVISPKDTGIVQFNQIYIEKPIIYIVNSQIDILTPLIKLLLPDLTIKSISSILQINTKGQKYIIFYICAELSKILDDFSKENKFLILDLPTQNDYYKYIYLEYPEIKLDKMNIGEIKSINVNKIVTTFQLSKCMIINKNTTIDNFIETIFTKFEYMRLYNSSNYYRIPMQSFSPEIILKINIIPLHPMLNNYLYELGVITKNDNPICKNTISTIKCNSSQLEENSFRLLGFN